MSNFFATSALVLATAVPAFAQTTSSIYLEGIENGVRASDFIGKRVYLTEADTTGMSDTALADADTNWQDGGEISDLIISLSGDTEAVLVDFGGFLGMGEKTVALDLNQLSLVPDADSPDDYFIVFKGTKTELESAATFNPDMVFDATNADAMTTAEPAADTTMAADPANTDVAAGTTVAPEDGTMATTTAGEMVDLSTWVEADLIGMRVYGPNNEDVGEISAVSVDADGKIAGAVVDVGGFIGIGEKPVVLTSDTLTLVKDGETSKFVVNATQEQLEAMETFSG